MFSRCTLGSIPVSMGCGGSTTTLHKLYNSEEGCVRWTRDRRVLGSNPGRAASELFGNSVYPTLPTGVFRKFH